MATAEIIIQDPHRRMLKGHPWVFGTQVLRVQGHVEPGDIVRVIDAKKGPVGQGYYNPASQIRVRMLTRSIDVPIDDGFFRERLRRAWDLRQRTMPGASSVRAVFGESDGLPALIVDKFNDVLVLQTLSLGIERWKETIVETLRELIKPRGIYERNDVSVREKEGLQQHKGFIGEAFDTRLTIEENDLKFAIDVATGQKTGHFLDQRLNHAAMRMISDGAEVLDCFTHTGGFGLHAARYGAKSVLGLDISKDAVELAKANAELNGLGDRCAFEAANVFDFLAEASRAGKRWDVVVLDPPAFAKNRASVENAVRGYKEINLRAMKCIPPGGFLVTCSCSFHMGADIFRDTVAKAAVDAGRIVREVYQGSQPPDHPILWGAPETHYLKTLILQVL